MGELGSQRQSQHSYVSPPRVCVCAEGTRRCCRSGCPAAVSEGGDAAVPDQAWSTLDGGGWGLRGLRHHAKVMNSPWSWVRSAQSVVYTFSLLRLTCAVPDDSSLLTEWGMDRRIPTQGRSC